MNNPFFWVASVVFVLALGLMGVSDYEDRQIAEQHKAETLAEAKKQAALTKARWKALAIEAERMTSFSMIGQK